MGKKTILWKATEAAGDNYHGNVAQTYLAERVDNPVWHREHEAVGRYLGLFADGASVLDVPFGTGRFAPLYAAKNMRVAGVDISADMLEVARAEIGPAYDEMDIRVGSAESLPYETERFDVLVSIRFLESIIPMKLVEPCLREFRRVTKQAAIVKLNTRAPGLAPVAHPSPEDRMGDAFFMEEVEALVARCGWRVEASEIVDTRMKGAAEKRIFLLKAA
jgi:SAM-dependent methyltransferase